LSNSVPKLFSNLKIINPDEKIVYCKKCVMSNQRPRLQFNDDGICAACLYSEYKKTMIDWDKREQELSDICDKFRSEDGSWDCVVPGSGGKDSGYVTYMLKKKYDMHPLSVTWAPSIPTEIGQQNLYNFIQSGYDNITGTPNGEIHRKLSKITFEEFGDNFLPFIYGQLNFPFNIATKFNIPLIFFGEDGDVEYGGSFERFDKSKLDMDYTVKSKFSSLPPDYWAKFGINSNQLGYYMPPTTNDLEHSQVEAHYFSYFENWKPDSHYDIVKQHLGFIPLNDRSEGTYTNFASLDDKSDGFHYYMAFIKFGIGRTTSDAAHQIRDGIITRDEGVDLVHKYDDEFPSLYLKEFLDYAELDMNSLNDIFDKFRRKIVWKKENDRWILREQVQKLN
jgi:N-acetyl sugar amidotransferase